MAVDPETYSRFLVADKKARDLGLALIEVLDHAQLLLTAKRRHNIEVSTLEDLARRLSRQSPNKLMTHYLGRVEGTSAEMFEATRQWVDAVCRNMANGTLEEL
jgi:HAMP domain-containing protein